MSTPEIPFPYTDAEVVHAFGELKPPEAIDQRDHKHLFWDSDPTGVWQERAETALHELGEGADLVLISGSHGTGKTQQFVRFMRERAGGLIREDGFPNESTLGNEKLWQSPIVLIDEATGWLGFVPEAGTELAKIRLDKSRVVTIFPGPSQVVRQTFKDRLAEGVIDQRPESSVVDLGDVSVAPVDTDKATMYLSQIGADEGAIELVNGHTALRAPRMFSALFEVAMPVFLTAENDEARKRVTDAFEADDVIRIIRAYTGDRSDGSARRGVVQMVFKNGESNLGRHQALLTQQLTTEDSLQLYELAGEPVPTLAQLRAHGPTSEALDRLGYNPFEKD